MLVVVVPQMGSNNVDEVAWYRMNIGDETHPVGQRKLNDFGLYDMTGNVNEWCWDRMELDDDLNIIGDSLYLHGPVTDPYRSEVGFDRVFRGGAVDTIRGRFVHRIAAATVQCTRASARFRNTYS